MADDLENLQAELDDALGRISDLESENDRLTDEIEALNSKVEGLQGDLDAVLDAAKEAESILSRVT